MDDMAKDIKNSGLYHLCRWWAPAASVPNDLGVESQKPSRLEAASTIGVIKWEGPIFGGMIKQWKSVVILRDFDYESALYGGVR